MADFGGKVVVIDTDDEPRQPSEEEVKEYAAFLGIDVDSEPHLMWIAWEGVAAPVPHPWKACHNTEAENEDEIFYFNFVSGESVWDHPCDEKYRQMVDQARAEALQKPSDGGGAGQAAAAAPGGADKKDGDDDDDDDDDDDSPTGDEKGKSVGLGGPEVILSHIDEADEESASSSDSDGGGRKKQASGGDQGKKGDAADLDASISSTGSRSGAAGRPEAVDSPTGGVGLKKQLGRTSEKKRDLGDSGEMSPMSSPREGPSASGAAAEAERKRLQPITDEISDEESIVDDVADSSLSEAAPGKKKLPPLKGLGAVGGGGGGGGGGKLAPLSGGPRAGDAAAGGGSGGDAGAGGPRQASADRGLAGVGLAVRASDDEDEDEAPAGDAAASPDRADASASASVSESQSKSASRRQNDGPKAKLENSGLSGRSGRGESSGGASEISEDFASELEGLTPGGSRGAGAGAPSSKFGDTLELSATGDNEDSAMAAAAAAAASAAAASRGGCGGAAAERGGAACGAQAGGASVPSAAGEPFLSLEAQVDSLTRTLDMLKDVRAKQREYLRLLQVA